jgi:predicted DNA-binding protein
VTEKHEQQIQTAIRFPESFYKRLDKLVGRMSEPGKRFTRIEVLRLAAFRGIAELETETKKR